ncbi:reprolysin-like metallopeptidase [Dyadobacter arcticus]|uniref:Peptidase M12B domain-containing protein n=1 Tax=Dyadobacter arcticus TaxID=1078754 RepID=A0ABX0UQG2_9BACT|nr:zinc-dependent metalloprotease family protein [Dyadobacter arcticus]NIJ55232.1 hypothetical protein [Dyadobacter arcticus]
MKFKFYHRLIVVVTILSTSLSSSFAQKGFFSEAPINARLDQSITKHITKLSLYRLKTGDLRNYLLNAQLEFKSKTAKGLDLEIPLPNGTTETFNLFESPILAPEIAVKHPDIKTYAGKGNSHKEYTIRVNMTSGGFNAIILGVENDAVYFEKTSNDVKDNLYRAYFSRDAQSPKTEKNKTSNNRCGTLDTGSNTPALNGNGKNERVSATASTGTDLRTFRLAMAANAEFTAQKGATPALAFIALTNYVNNLNAVYRKELSVALMLVTGEEVVYSGTDPYNNDDQEAMLDQNQTNLDLVVTAGYDIGHVLGYVGGSGGGIASRGSVCDPSTKGQGVSGVGDGSFADVFDQQLIQHEIGHQFNMTHSYNSNVPVCTTRTLDTSVEPGSGTTIMSYGYTCDNSDAADGLVGNDDYEAPYAPILNFHTVNYDQATAFISGLSCFTSTPTFNAIPVISTMQATWTIPKSTPFALSGSATDADAGDVLSYSWEGTNISDVIEKADLTATTISDPTRPPFFRSYAPISISQSADPGTRYYPRLSAILDGSNYVKGDKLPSIGIATTHRLTVRDNDSGVEFADVTVTVDAGSGPFLITNDTPGSLLGLTGSHLAGSPQTILWSVNNTNDPLTINCQLVDILLSTDGGLTFPTTLASAVPNNGIAIIIFPLTANTIRGRIKVAASSSNADLPLIGGRTMANTPNIFFDISNVNFGINTALPVTLASFNVELKGKNNASLTWETSEETNNAGFDIEMSPDARNFVKVGYVDGNGDSKISHQYQYSINDLAGGHYYFRLKQLDYDGKFEYSQIRTLEIISSSDILAVYPNPTSGKLKFNPNMHKNQVFSVQVANQSGKIVLSLPASASYTSGYELDASSLASGLYHIVIQGANFTENLKFVKL